jgi:cytochrome d ubiquinol oxidase subunit I
LIANGWMQNPVGSAFNPDTMRMEIVDFAAVLFNPVAQAKFVHTVSAVYVTGAVFVLAVSSFFLLSNRYRGFAKRSITVASAFGLASALSVVVLGDESGYALTDNQKMKLASIEAMWHTEPAPAPLTVVGFPNVEEQKTEFAINVPWVLGIIATRSFDGEVAGILDLVEQAEHRIENGIGAYDAMMALRANPDDEAARAAFDASQADLRYALLLRRYVEDPRDASAEQISQAVYDTIPDVASMFWSFRLMAGFGFYFIALFGVAFVLTTFHRDFPRWFLKLALFSLPLPWLAAELGWFLAEYGRQPWIIEGALPTFLGVSSLSVSQIIMTMAGFTLLYGALAVVEVFLMVTTIRQGPYPLKSDTFDLGLGGPAAAPQPAE